jgi:hypothetical protein
VCVRVVSVYIVPCNSQKKTPIGYQEDLMATQEYAEINEFPCVYLRLPLFSGGWDQQRMPWDTLHMK